MVARLEHMTPANIDNFAHKETRLSAVKPLVSIVIPTLYRSESLEIAFQSAASQIALDYDIEIIIADNSPDAGAKDQVETLSAQTSLVVKYISVPEPGVSNARNGAMTLVQGQYLAFLDDDQEATPHWISAMITQCLKDNSSAVFAHIEGRSEVVSKNLEAKLAFFSRLHNGEPSGRTEKFYGCGASLIDISKIDLELIHFDTARNETGGEDDAFFNAIQKAGGTFSWSQEALVFENVPSKRIKKLYIARRSFAFGQGPSLICLEKDSYSIVGLIKWMAIGSAQIVAYFPLAALSWPLENAFHMKCLHKGCEGAGKVFWQPYFRPKFYGQTIVDKLNEKNAS